MSAVVPRGIRCNNPGNIKEAPGDKTEWVGERATDDDPVFEEFESPVYGIRALARILLSYYRRYHLKSVGAIISRWAPPGENDTTSYIAHACQIVGVTADQELSIDKPHILRAIVRAIILHENGQCPYASEIDDGVAMALRPDSA